MIRYSDIGSSTEAHRKIHSDEALAVLCGEISLFLIKLITKAIQIFKETEMELISPQSA